jgi:predicted Ser/Thr protein kinase
VSPDNANDQLRNGQVLADRYRIERVIGRGGMAEVYQGHDDRLARPVALKVLHARFGSDPDLRRRFEEEAKAAAMVSHPNIVAVYDAGEDDSKAFIVMELVNGETLHDLIGRGPVPSALARSIGGQVLDALGAAHSKGVLHRDIKPANVLFTPDGQAKVTDFGIAKAIHPSPDADQTTMNMVLGTPSYLAPERAQGLPATVASDLWAVGVLLYEAVTGVKPFEGDNPLAITLAAQQARYVPVLERRPDLDPSLASVIERAIDPEPRARFSSAAEMAAALRGDGGPEATGLLGSAAGGAGALAGAAGAEALGSTRVLTGAGGLAGGALAGEGALGAAGATTGRLGVAGATGVHGTQALSREEEAWAAGEPRSRRGLAVLIGAALALLLGGLLALILTSSGTPSPGPGRLTTTTTHLVGSTPTTQKSTTTTTVATTTTAPSTTTTTTSSTTTTTTASTTTTAPSTTTTLPPTTTTIPPTTTTTAGGPPVTGTSTAPRHGHSSSH